MNGWQVPLADVRVDAVLLDAATATLESGWWSAGPRVEEFEAAFAASAGVEHAVAVSSGTAALHLALLAIGVGPGDEVVLPSLTFVAAANVVRHVGATPVFCDIKGAADLNLDPASVAAAVTERTKAILVLHYGGYACDLDALEALAGDHGVELIEDAAHAPGGQWRGRACGTFGRVGCFSFFSNKNMPIGEGGMAVTSDSEVAERLRHLRSHGMTRASWDRHRGHASEYDVLAPGLNYRLDEVRAALGLVQLERLPGENAARAEIVTRYRRAFSEADGIEWPFDDEDDRRSPAYHLAVVLVPDTCRETIRAELAAAGIQTSVHYPPIHSFSAYRGSRADVANTEAIAGRLLTLPLYGHLTEAQVGAVIDTLLEAVAAAASDPPARLAPPNV